MYSILRSYHPEATTGILLDPMGMHLCVTLERPWLENKDNISCIPEGTYHVIQYNSPSKGDVWLFKNVPDRDMIEIHPANHMEQLLGCIAVGERLTENIVFGGIIRRYWITDSKATMKRLKKTLPDNFVVDIRKG